MAASLAINLAVSRSIACLFNPSLAIGMRYDQLEVPILRTLPERLKLHLKHLQFHFSIQFYEAVYVQDVTG